MSDYKQAPGSKNCMQCSVGYLLGLALDAVPNFANSASVAEAWDQFSEFVNSRGYAAVMLPGTNMPDADYLASGKTIRGTSHMVVMRDGKLIHDPHPSGDGISDVQSIWLLVKRAPNWGWSVKP